MLHELEHQAQDANAWRGAFWRNTFGGEHACEKEAWQRGFQVNYNWMRRLSGLAADGRLTAEERAAAARKLEVLASMFSGYRKNYNTSYGPITITTPDGFTITLDEAVAEAQATEKKARDLVALAETSVSRPLNQPPEGFVGTFRGRLTGDATGDITFVLRGKAMSVECQGREGRRGAGFSCSAPESMVTYDPVTGEFSALLMGARDNPDGEGLGMLLALKVQGQVLREKITGTWSFKTYDLQFRGDFQATR